MIITMLAAFLIMFGLMIVMETITLIHNDDVILNVVSLCFAILQTILQIIHYSKNLV
jgi:hypothetical protein